MGIFHLKPNQQMVQGFPVNRSYTKAEADKRFAPIGGSGVTSVFGRTGVVVAVSGDYNTSQVTENTNLYFTNARAVTALTGQSNAIFTNGAGYLTSNQTITLSGDVTGSGSTAITTVLATAQPAVHTWALAQTFTVGVITPKIYPSADSTTAIQILKADGTTAIGTWDTTNSRLGIGTTAPNEQLEITKNFRFPVTTSSTVGVILQGANSFIHTYGAANPVAGDANLFIGRSAGNFTLDTTQALGSLAVGDNALNALTTGQYNTAIGSQALLKNTTGIRNTAIGLALYANTTGGNNVGLGLNALYQNTTGSQNLGIGTGALGQMISGNGNIGIGFNALTWGTVGSTNIGIGALTGGGNGNNNIWIGDHNGGGAIGTSNNTGIGFQGMGWLGAGITGGNNTGIGYKSGGNLTSGANNLLLGYQTSDALTTGSNNIAIGYDIDLPSNTGSNQLTIGNLIFGDNTSTGTTISTGNIGMGIATSLGAKLHIVKTTEQLRVGYDPSNYYSTTVGSTGGVTFDAVGAGAGFTFSDMITSTNGYTGSDLTASKLVLTDANKKLISGTTANLVTAGVAIVVASTFEKAETGSDANVLTYTSGGADEALMVGVAVDVSALSGTSIVVTITWKDSNNSTATSSTTLSGVGAGFLNVPLNSKTATNVVVSTTFVGVSTAYNITAVITRYK